MTSSKESPAPQSQKRSPGRPRKRPIQPPPVRTGKLGEGPGKASRITLPLSEKQKSKLERLARSAGITYSEQIRRLIDRAPEPTTDKPHGPE